MEKKEKKVTAFLKDCIVDALLELMKTKPIEKITADDIAKASGVGRTTYFRHFSSKEDVIVYRLKKLYFSWVENHPAMQSDTFNRDMAISYFKFNESIKELLLFIYEKEIQIVLFMALRDVMTVNIEARTVYYYRQKFSAYGLYGLLDAWIIGGFAESAETMGDYLCQFIKS